MKILDHINEALQPFLTGAGKLWHQSVEPWLAGFLSNVSQAEVKVVTDTAAGFVEQALPELTKAAASGDWKGFADAQGEVLAATAGQLEQNAVKVAVTSLTTGVNALIVGHPAVVAASTPPAAVAA